MLNIAFIDIEVDSNHKIKECGIYNEKFKAHLESKDCAKELNGIIKQYDIDYYCGHNFINHDFTYLKKHIESKKIIDTLYLALLLDPASKHALKKAYKTNKDSKNNPFKDCIETYDKFNFFNKKFDTLESKLKEIYIFLLNENKYFKDYFVYKNIKLDSKNVEKIFENIKKCDRKHKIKNYAFLKKKLDSKKYNLELAFCLSFLFQKNDKVCISQYILENHYNAIRILQKLTFDKNYSKNLIFYAKKILKNFKSFKPNQQKIIESSLKNFALDSNFAILQTSGGKTLCFMLPALIAALSYKGLSVVISPLKALMQNHFDIYKNIKDMKIEVYHGDLDSRKKSEILRGIKNGKIDLLFIAPESLRNNAIYYALRARIIARFIIDEAHCISAWGHDFRTDYFFISRTINELQNNIESKLPYKIPVSLFSATAKKDVIKEIEEHFKNRLNINLNIINKSSKRNDLKYSVIKCENESDKFKKLCEIINKLKPNKKSPMLIYTPLSVNDCKELKNQLQEKFKNKIIESFYADLDADIKIKILNDFMNNKIEIMIATSAFGMGIDKENIRSVIHYTLSDSLESYLQESGRGSRDGRGCECVMLFTLNDFIDTESKIIKKFLSFASIENLAISLNNRLAIEKKTYKDSLFLTPRTLAIYAKSNDSKTALLELEKLDFIKRKRDFINVFATSVHIKNSNIDSIKDKYMKEFMQYILNLKEINMLSLDKAFRDLSLPRKHIRDILDELKKHKFIDYKNDISVFYDGKIDLQNYINLENLLLDSINSKDNIIDFKKIKRDVNDIESYKNVLKSFANLNDFLENNNRDSKIFEIKKFTKYYCRFCINDSSELKNLVILRQQLYKHIIETLDKNALDSKGNNEVIFCELEMLENFNNNLEDSKKVSQRGLQECLDILESLGDNFRFNNSRSFLYKRYEIQILKNIEYSQELYNENLGRYHKNQLDSVRIFKEFLLNIESRDNFISDYFSLDMQSFKEKYIKDSNILYDNLCKEQKEILDSKDSMIILARAGSGKTEILARKVIKILSENSHKKILMLTHQNAATNAFKDRINALSKLLNLYNNIEIYTIHKFALNILGKNLDSIESNNDKNAAAIIYATKYLNSIESNLEYDILAIDELQDIDSKFYHFLKAIYDKMPSSKEFIAVGDTLQMINNFDNESIDDKKSYINQIINGFESTQRFSIKNLNTNHRSLANIITFANAYKNNFIDNNIESNMKSSKENNGKINITYYQNDYMKNIANILEQKDSNKTCGIFFRTNEEVDTFCSYLLLNYPHIKFNKKSIYPKFSLIDLMEFDQFLKHLNDGFTQADKKMQEKYKNSTNFNLYLAAIRIFEKQNLTKEYNKEAFIEFLESQDLESLEMNKNNITITTIHKAKGLEFDIVHFGLNGYGNNREAGYETRLIYMAITRAKEELNIHIKDDIQLSYLNFKFAKDLNIANLDSKDYPHNDAPLDRRVSFVMGLNDINLGMKKNHTKIIQHIKAGDKAKVYYNDNKISIIAYDKNVYIGTLAESSKNFYQKVQQYEIKGYTFDKEAEVKYLVKVFVEYTYDEVKKQREEVNKEYCQVLCKISITQKNIES